MEKPSIVGEGIPQSEDAPYGPAEVGANEKGDTVLAKSPEGDGSISDEVGSIVDMGTPFEPVPATTELPFVPAKDAG